MALFVLVIAATVVLPGLVAPEESGEASEVQVVQVDGAVPVQVVRIIDGDTLVVRSAGTELTVRLYGVNTPERGERCYEEATDQLDELAGDLVQLMPDARLTDPFGRELRYVYASDATLIDQALVAEGYGYAWTDDGSLREQIIAAETEARAEGRGCLWSGR